MLYVVAIAGAALALLNGLATLWWIFHSKRRFNEVDQRSRTQEALLVYLAQAVRKEVPPVPAPRKRHLRAIKGGLSAILALLALLLTQVRKHPLGAATVTGTVALAGVATALLFAPSGTQRPHQAISGPPPPSITAPAPTSATPPPSVAGPTTLPPPLSIPLSPPSPVALQGRFTTGPPTPQQVAPAGRSRTARPTAHAANVTPTRQPTPPPQTTTTAAPAPPPPPPPPPPSAPHCAVGLHLDPVLDLCVL